jgi:hypothetical protein
MLIFLVFTGLQSLRVSVKLALFTNTLAIAVLIAAFLRVHKGWPGALNGLPEPTGHSGALDFWQGLSLMSAYAAPLALLAANFGYRSEGRKQVVKAGLFGLALPLAATLLFVGLINVATFQSPFYRYSVGPSVAMALWSRAASSAIPIRMVLVAMTILGATRFGIWGMAESLLLRRLSGGLRLAVWSGIIGAILWLSFHLDTTLLTALETSAEGLTVASAVVTADFLCGAWRVQHIRKVDWVGIAALIAGLTARFYAPEWIVGNQLDWWWYSSLLPSWGAAFLVCLSGRAGQNRLHWRIGGAPRRT